MLLSAALSDSVEPSVGIRMSLNMVDSIGKAGTTVTTVSRPARPWFAPTQAAPRCLRSGLPMALTGPLGPRPLAMLLDQRQQLVEPKRLGDVRGEPRSLAPVHVMRH